MIKVAAGFVVFRVVKSEIQYLLLQASNGKHHWTPPKGHVDESETELEAAYRETLEEAGLLKSDLKLYDFKRTLRYYARGAQKRVVYWLAQVNPSCAVKISAEHQDWRWLNVNDIMVFISEFRDMQQVIQEAEEYLQCLQR